MPVIEPPVAIVLQADVDQHALRTGRQRGGGHRREVGRSEVAVKLIVEIHEVLPEDRAGADKAAPAPSHQRRLTTLSDTRVSRRPRYWLAIGSSATSIAAPWPKPLNLVRIAQP